MHQQRSHAPAGSGEHLWTGGVDAVRILLLVLRVIDAIEGRGVEDDLGPNLTERALDGVSGGDVELAMIEGDRLVPDEDAVERAAELSSRAGDDDRLHQRPLAESTRSMLQDERIEDPPRRPRNLVRRR